MAHSAPITVTSSCFVYFIIVLLELVSDPTNSGRHRSCRNLARYHLFPSISYTITDSSDAGPLTCKGPPAIAPATSPPTMPVISPAADRAPEAMAMPGTREVQPAIRQK